MEKVSVSWSGGKDSAFSLYKILNSGKYVVASLHTTINKKLKRVGLHGIREELIDIQANSVGIPLEKIYTSTSDNHEEYEEKMEAYCKKLKSEEINKIVYGDIFLEDLKLYREKQLKKAGLQGIFPLWGHDTNDLLNEFLDVGFETLICSADAKFFDKSDLGKILKPDMFEGKLKEVDPCGENGEFHTFTYKGPVFSKPVEIVPGEKVLKHYDFKLKDENGQIRNKRSSFWFLDLLLG